MGNLCPRGSRYPVATAPIIRLFELLTDGGEVAKPLTWRFFSAEQHRFIYYHLGKRGYRREIPPQMI